MCQTMLLCTCSGVMVTRGERERERWIVREGGRRERERERENINFIKRSD